MSAVISMISAVVTVKVNRRSRASSRRGKGKREFARSDSTGNLRMLCANGVAAGADEVNGFTAALRIHLFQDAMDVIPYGVLG